MIGREKHDGHSRSASKASASGRFICSATIRSGFVILSRVWYSSPGVRSTHSSPRPAPTLRLEIRDHQCRPALYRQRHRSPAGTGSQITCSSPPGSWDRVFVIAAGREYPRLAARDRGSQAWRKIVVANAAGLLALVPRDLRSAATARSSPRG